MSFFSRAFSKFMQAIRQNGALCGVLLLALCLRLPLLNGSFWLDEAAQAMESVRPLSQQLNIVDDFQPPLMHLLVHFLMDFSHAEWWLRFGAALLPGLITIWGTYELGRRLANKRVGLVAALFLAVSSLHIFYSQELRPYSFPAMCAVLSWLVLLQWSAKKVRFASREMWFFSLLTLAGMYSSYLYPFFFFAQCVYVIWRKRMVLREFAMSCVVVGLGFLPWIPSFLAQLHAGQNLRSALPGWENVVSFDQVKSILLVYGKFVFGVVHLEVNAKFILVSALFAIILSGFLWAFWSRRKEKSWPKLRESFVVLLVWFVVPLLSAWLVSFVVPVIQPKRVLFLLPALCLLLSFLFIEAKQHKFVQNTAIIIFLLLSLSGILQYYTQPQYQREDWRDLHALIVTKYSPSDSIAVFAFPAPFAPWQWYDDGSYPTYSTGVLSTADKPDMSDMKKVTNYRYILVFDYLRDLTDPQNSILTQLQSYGYQEIDRITPSTPIGFVRVYARKTSTISSVQH